MFIFLLVCSLLVPLSMIILGKRWENNPPEDINGLSGYRTTMSRLNKDTWSYAHKYWGKINFYLVFTQIAIMALTIIPTEIKLNNVFTKEGYRNQKNESRFAEPKN